MPMQPDDLPEIPAELAEAIHAFLDQSIRHILRHEDSEHYFQSLTEIAQHSGMTAWFDDRMPWWGIGRSIWNATPLPAKQFRSATLPPPRRNDPCPCGSGNKFKRCCQPLESAHAMSLAEEVPIGRMAVALFTQQQRQAAAKQAPAKIRLLVAEHELEQNHPGKARKQLLALLDNGGLDEEQQTHAVQLLGDAYEALGHLTAGEKALHERIPGLKSMAAAAALHWLTSRALEDDRPAEALTHLLYAEHLDPDSLINGLLKVVCLRALGDDGEAQRTAQEWLPLAQELGDQQAIELLEEQASMATLPPTSQEASPSLEADDDLLSLFGAPDEVLRPITGLLKTAFRQPLPQVHFNPGPPGPDGNESQWVLVLPTEIEKAQAVFYQASESPHPLDPTLIRQHPALLQSPDFLEQLVAFTSAPLGNKVQQQFNEALYRQRNRLIDHFLAVLPASAQLPWGWIEHRPVLRLLMHRALEQPDLQASIEGLSQVLALCPNDNLGVRAPLINSLLRAGHDTEALAIAEQYPEDHLAETRYGRVLALVRLSRLHEAEKALKAAHAALPKVLNYLIAKQRKQPKLDPNGIVIGGNDQAWYYREDMRDVFLETPGMIGWLESIRKRLPPA